MPVSRCSAQGGGGLNVAAKAAQRSSSSALPITGAMRKAA